MKRQQCNQQLPYRILSALERGPKSVKELMAQLHRSETQTIRAVKELHAQQLIHKAEYRRSKRGTPTLLWALGRGNGIEPVKPVLLTGAERAEAWRNRGGDAHRARRLKTQATKIAKGATMWGGLL